MGHQDVKLRLGLWQWIFLCLMGGGVFASLLGAVRGLGAVTNLSDTFPWGICSGLNVFGGIALATGGFIVAATIYVLDIDDARPVLRASLLLAACGYMVAVLALIGTLGQPARILPLLARSWSARSVLAGLIFSILLFAAILLLEFAPELFGRFHRRAPAWTRWLVIPLTLLATAIAMLHQSVLARLVVLSGGRFSPLWVTPRLPMLFLVSAICVALAVIVFASFQARRALGSELFPAQLTALSRAMAIMLFLYLALRVEDFVGRGMLGLLFQFRAENYFLGLELSLFLLPMLLLLDRRIAAPGVQHLSAVLVIGGFLANRLNTAITSMEAGSGAAYVPKWTEVLIAYSLIAWGVASFTVAARRLGVFPRRADLLPANAAPWPHGADSPWSPGADVLGF